MQRLIIPDLPQPLTLLDNLLDDLPVITPTKPIARSLNVPQYSLETLAETIVHQQGIAIASSLLSRRLMQDTVREVLSVKDVVGVAVSWLNTIRELFRSGIDFSALQEFPSKRIQYIAAVAISYQQILRKLNCLDSAELFWQAASNCQRNHSYLFYGYFVPAKDQIAFINAIAGNGSILVLPTGKSAIFTANNKKIEFLQSQGWKLETVKQKKQNLGTVLQQCFLQQQPAPTEVKLYAFANLEAEVRGILNQIKALLNQGVTGKDIVLVGRDEPLYGATLLDIAWEYDIPIRAFYDIPLEATRLGAWIKNLLEVIAVSEKNFPFEVVTKLLRHPLAKQIDADTWQKARLNYPVTIEAWAEISIDLSLLQFPSQSSRGNYYQLIQIIFDSWKIQAKSQIWAKEIIAFYRLQEALYNWSQLSKESISKYQFIQELQEIINIITIPIQPGRGGIEFHSPLSLPGAKYQYVFVLGMVDGIFPSTITEDLVLDFCNRKQLFSQGYEVPTAVSIAQKEKLYFYCLLQVATKQITFSYPILLDTEETIPSPYLQALNLQVSPIEPQYIASLEEKRQIYLQQKQTTKDTILQNAIQAWNIEKERETSPTIGEYQGAINISLSPDKFTFSASQLTQLGQCPFKWFSARLLQLKPLPELELDLTAKTKGNIYHRCLDSALEDIKTATDLEKFNRQKLQELLLQAETALAISQQYILSWQQKKQELIELLYRNLIHPNFLPSDTEVIAREYEFKIEWYGLKIQGQIDRIDRTTTGLKVLDYKSSSTTPSGIKDSSNKASIDLQLPLYIDAVKESFTEESVEASYYLLPTQKIRTYKKRPQQELADFAEKVKSHLEKGYYPVEPDIQQKACQYCNFDLVCRKQ
ncbi:MAG: PD-(D/E)XK nuclease family protein [Xenococcaceae cyanobacterium MO_234.B1]|nr:PD-(D/E)XK nuclease family protein [Xenococcaceae cyanobacterium MO_234.B1]